jgi:N-acetylated-alpha-linked acidic dipeptidase
MLLRLANADILPYDYVEFVQTMQRYVPALDRALAAKRWTSTTTTALRDAMTHMQQEAASFTADRDATLRAGKLGNEKLQAVNTELFQVERAFTRPEGLRTRPWYRNLIYVADEDNGYANMVFPSVNEAIRAGDQSLTAAEISDLAKRFEAASRALVAARTVLAGR